MVYFVEESVQSLAWQICAICSWELPHLLLEQQVSTQEILSPPEVFVIPFVRETLYFYQGTFWKKTFMLTKGSFIAKQ